MQESQWISWTRLFAVALLVTVVVFAWCIWRGRFRGLSKRGAVAAMLPGLLLLISFYTLAIHMYVALGQWPKSIGAEGFPTALVVHANITAWCAMVMFYIVSLWPLAMLILVGVKSLRRFVPYASLFAVSAWVSFGLIRLAPQGFSNWWWD